MSNVHPFNPLEKKHLGTSTGIALSEQLAVPLGKLPQFSGGGIYALYYSGPFPHYKALTASCADGVFNVPIYVGKAIPEGSRRGGYIDAPEGQALRKRLMQHAGSVRKARNLDIDDFHCRFLVVDDAFIVLCEALMISRFGPLWNSIIDGFGNNAPGKGREEGLCPRWDTLHPGRPWAERLPQRSETAADIGRDAEQYLATMLGGSQL